MKKIQKLNFCCGKDIKKGKEWINVDIQKAEGRDKSFNFDKFPYPFKDNEFDYILVDNVLEHLKNPRKVILEFWRISKPNAIIEVIVLSFIRYVLDYFMFNFYTGIKAKIKVLK